MRHNCFLLVSTIILGFTVGLVRPALAVPVSTAFTFQGRLTDGGSPPTGTYDLQFKLFDALTGGAQVGSTIQLDNVSVTNGLFTVSLNFGAQFNSDALWLELGVHPGAQPVGNPYTILAPRQALTGAPYALGVRLPLSETVSTSSPAVSIANTGTGRAASFTSDNTGSSVTALRVDTNSTNAGVAALAGVNTGTGHAAIFQTGSSILNIDGDSINSNVSGFLNTMKLNDSSGDFISICAGGGNVGIGGGTAALPLTRLHVDGGSDVVLETNTSGFFLLGSSSGANIVMDNNEIMARNNGVASTLFLNHNGGEVHIGQGTGGSATGRLRVPVLQITGGSDFSENFDVAASGEASAEPGMVVCIDAQHPGKVTLCTKAYDRTVAGVISGAGGVRPGMLMGQSDTLADGSHPVALTGRVYVHCDVRQHAIEPGDLLTTSDKPGHAMKVMDHARAPGAIIGKAMTALPEGETGLVLVLVSLQ
ncbi:MAG TPA: hypothetical protein VGM03_15255 [Phycisphaerae bacterium]